MEAALAAATDGAQRLAARLSAALDAAGPDERRRLAATALIAVAGAVLLARIVLSLLRFLRREYQLRAIPSAPGSNLLLGHALALLRAPEKGKAAWDLIEEWAQVKGNVCRYRILGTHSVIIADPGALKRVFQTRFKNYVKDLRLSYHPFLPILGTGLVTADGDLWQKQRLLMAPALRVDILDDIIPIAKRAVDRLADKLEGLRGTGTPVHLEEEFRLLTLQVAAEAAKAFGRGDAAPTRRAADEMLYTLSVLKEALRKYSVVPVVTRELVEDDTLAGYRIPAGTMITCQLQSVHNQWRDPAEFRPERFMPGGEYDEFDESIRAYMFLPFIQGPRNCLGQHLALLEARVVLAALTKRFKFTPLDATAGRRHLTVVPVASVGGMPVRVD
ncbi:cytochrome P450 [Raphidocelis subcapitata]|uniref:Cytochrome P450 n=1 Tax=Raphidocelis subcapitata TaxID=307507 RepID=A0A2V0P4G4_9CHLO|nr:cytochrome P450 [Raphidocelis subcapitata]|eukprot:GBF94771.1 cytochrome P450 [Raphidocelis subcapitata]